MLLTKPAITELKLHAGQINQQRAERVIKRSAGIDFEDVLDEICQISNVDKLNGFCISAVNLDFLFVTEEDKEKIESTHAGSHKVPSLSINRGLQPRDAGD